MDDLKQREIFENYTRGRPSDHPVVSFYARQRLEAVARWFDLHSVSSALDVGCGNGFSTYYMREHIANIFAVDQSNYMLTRHLLKSSGQLSQADAARLPFADNSFDLVYCWEVLHHLSNPALTVAEMARVSRQYVLLVEPNGRHPLMMAFALTHPEERWLLRFTSAYIRKLLKGANLRIQHLSRGGWIFPNLTPLWMLPILGKIPYHWPPGNSYWALGLKQSPSTLHANTTR
jgi:ubiquinone/menaquinone biosynthesis C-methylase UbiE